MLKYLSIFAIMIFSLGFSQIIDNDSIISVKSENVKKISERIVESTNSPTRAGLYSAVVPGLGQYYNKKYWKIPLVWGAVGTGVGITIWNQKQYNRYRNAFVAELNGQKHEFSDIKGITKEVLGRAQDRAKRQRDYAIAISGLIYVLGIVDAVVDAHLYEQRKDPDLVILPVLIHNEWNREYAKAGFTLSYTF